MNMILFRKTLLYFVFLTAAYTAWGQCPSGTACATTTNTGPFVTIPQAGTLQNLATVNAGAVRRYRFSAKLGDVYDIRILGIAGVDLALTIGHTDGSFVAQRNVGGAGGNERMQYFCYKDGDYQIIISEDPCTAISGATSTTLEGRKAVDATTANTWYVHFLNSTDRSLDGSYDWQVTYDGGTGLNFNSNGVFTTNTSDPYTGGDAADRVISCSSAAMPTDDHTGVVHRTGFPCGRYTIELISVDDDVKLYVNDMVNGVFNDNDGVAGIANSLPYNMWTGNLNAASVVSVRWEDYTANSNVRFNVNDISVTNGGSIAYAGGNVCSGSQPGAAITNAGAATSNYAAVSYTWEMSTTGASSGFSTIGGQTGTTLAAAAIGALTQNVWIRRTASDGCHTFYSNVIAITIDAPSNAGSFVTTPLYGCPAGIYTYNASGTITTQSVTGITGSVQNWEYGTNANAWFNWGGTNTTAPGNSSFYPGTSQADRMRVNVKNGVCPPATNTIIVTDATVTALAGNAISSCTGSGVAIPMSGASLSGGPVLSVSWGFTANSGSGTFSGTGTNPSSYSFTPTSASGDGTATVTVGTICGNITATRTIKWGVPAVSISPGAPLACSGGSFTITAGATSGNGPYTYLWDNGSTNASRTVSPQLAGTAYNVTVTDANNCTTTNTVNALDGNIALTATNTDATCGNSNGSATVAVTAGTGPYTYVWSNGVTTADNNNIQGGTYTVTVSGYGGCSAEASVNIAATGQISVAASGIGATCGLSNGSASVNVTAGTAPFIYTWSTGDTTPAVNNLQAATYTVTVQDAAACISINTIVVNPGAVLSIQVPVINSSCGNLNGSADVTVTSGTAPYVYAWNTGAVAPSLTGLAQGSYTVTVTDSAGCTATQTAVVSGSQPVALNTSAVNGTCGNANGSATVAVTSGSAPFTYLWNTTDNTASVSNLASGNYQVTVTDDNGCSATSAVQVNSGVTLTTTVSAIDATCGNANGSATINVTSGTSPYSFQWSSGSTSQTAVLLAAGNYFVTVTDAGNCTATATISVSNVSNIAANAQAGTTTCGNNNGSATATASSGTAPFSYAWSNGQTTPAISGLAAGTYTVTVSDAANCSVVKSVVVDSSATPKPVITANKNTICAGDSVQICAPSGYTNYLWNNTESSNCITVKQAGNYYLTVNDSAGCEGNSNRITITVIPAPAISITVNGDTMTSYNATTYQWYFENSLIPGATSSVYIAPQSGMYTLVITDGNGCSATSNPINIIRTAIGENIYTDAVSVYPNPTNGKWIFTVANSLLGSPAEVFDCTGSLIYRFTIQQPQFEFGYQLPNGVYVIRIAGPEESAAFKLIKY